MASEKSDPTPKSLPHNPLRDRAEGILQKTHRDLSRMPLEDMSSLVYELQVHQMELELQNEELRHAQAALGESLDRYTDLYDFAPVGYLTLDYKGRITEANLAAATMLGIDRRELVGSMMTDYIARESQDEFFLHRQALLSSKIKQACELQLHKNDETPLVVRMESVASGGSEQHLCRTALIDITTKVLAEEALGTLNDTLEQCVEERTKEVNLLAEALSHLGEGVLLTSDGLEWPGPEIVYVNDAMCRITGYTAEELIGQSPRILQGPDTDRKALVALREDLSAGRSSLAEFINYRKDGTPYHAEVFITPLFDAAAHRTNFVSVHRDITERKLNEEALRRIEARTTAILASLSAHIAVVDRSGQIVAVNPAWEQFARENEGDQLRCGPGVNYLEVCQTSIGSGEDLAWEVAAGLQSILEGRARTFSIEYPCHSPTEDRWFFLQITPLGGTVEGAVLSHANITARVLAEDALQSLGRIVEESLNEIYLFDAKSLRFLQVNRGARNNLGYSREELAEMTPLDLKPALSPRRFEALLKPLRTGQQDEVNFEARHRRKDGSFYDVEVHVQPTSINAKPCFVAIVLDTTKRRTLEQEVIKAAEEERQRIAHDLHDDLGSLLTGVKLRIEALGASLRDGELDPNGPSASTSIAQLVGEAIRKTREIARGLRPVGADPEDLMSALRRLSEQTGDTGTLRCRFSCPDPVLIQDPFLANHVFRIAQEAVHNAVKHSKGSRLVISLKEGDDAIELRIADNGVGIDPETYKSGGMGLHTMRYRARAINGALRIQGRKRGGTKIVCTVALPKSPAPAA